MIGNRSSARNLYSALQGMADIQTDQISGVGIIIGVKRYVK